MIYTVTLNPSLDYIVSLDRLEPGTVNRSSETYMFPGGKGINVSRVLHRLGNPSKALGFLGGYTGKFIVDALHDESIETDFVSVEENTRINVKVKADEETEINGTSSEIRSTHLDKLKEKLLEVTEDDVVIFAGSMPENLKPSLYRDLIELLPKGTRTVVDTKGVPLSQAVLANPFLIKPNHHELGDLFNVEIDSVEDAATYARHLIEDGAQNVIVSMAGDGALLATKKVTYFCNVPSGEVVNSVGAGDSVVAGFVSRYILSEKVSDAFKYGIAAGSASAFSIGFCTQSEVNELYKGIEVNKLG
ncbi:1-phosphofructokinase [Pseudalkalibacillus decolorationis]|uniref:1-phosphofructokinase n=1 Tax=Pseudalkalibacillus decolorationis TaxID=163879 RepID=UPI0021487AF7|nr:1-phosphofructokinase [Pseudalkalibacillus decolorationis]